MLMSASAIERYHDFLETYPDIVQSTSKNDCVLFRNHSEALSKVKGESVKSK